jgi:hypothetical protein
LDTESAATRAWLYLLFSRERLAVGRTGQFVLCLQLQIKFHFTEGSNSRLQTV